MKKFVLPLVCALALATTVPPAVKAQTPAKKKVELKYGATRTGKRQDPAMQRFRQHRVGALVCWGLFAIPGGEWNGKVYSGAAEWIQQWARIPTDQYKALAKQWNPQKFDARAWAKMAKDMGLKYVKITTKFHDGFCLWPSQYSDFTVAQTPYKKDILGELVKAYNDEGIDVHFYYSVLEWNHPDWRSSIKSREDSIAFSRFLKYEENQLRELATRYPTVKDFWFDGTWDASVKKNGWWTAHIEKMLKELVPGVTINSRLRADDYGRRHFDSNGMLMGDYESGYERKLPDPHKDFVVTTRDWEACMTLPENQWGYHKDWSLSYVKKPVEVLQQVVHAVSMGGNMAIDLGPQPDGDFRPEEKELARYLGSWLHKNGEAVYACDYAGWPKQDWGYFTKNEKNVFMVVFNQPFSGQLKVQVPAGVYIAEAQLLSGKNIGFVETTTRQYNISAPATPDGQPYVIRLTVTDKPIKNRQYREALT